ncbi:MAG: DDE-type integrase/transposase/recombinase [Planctomycetaceae bacterium]|nr:DDE-type integrase/transposase/recombinase [Planctomycetaceae bacterium]
MATDNIDWGAPRIHGELLKLGYKVSERTVSRYLSRLRPPKKSGNNWQTFLNNHRKGIAAMDFFTVPTLFFRQLYGFFIIRHDTRKIIHFGVTYHPTAEWVIEQLSIAFPENGDGIEYMIMDRATSFSLKVRQTLKEFGIEAVRTSYRSPWQNGIAERWVGSCRRELLNHIIPFNEKHLYILLSEYVDYYNKDRTHYSRDKEPPDERPVTTRQSPDDYVIALPRCGGLHHKYIWASAA